MPSGAYSVAGTTPASMGRGVLRRLRRNTITCQMMTKTATLVWAQALGGVLIGLSLWLVNRQPAAYRF